MNTIRPDRARSSYAERSRSAAPDLVANAVVSAVQHSLFWLVLGNLIGALIALLLLVPRLNAALGEWTYGRWIMVHMNLALYGWCSLPLVGFLLSVYGAHRGRAAYWARPAVWAWSSALVLGSFSWLSGHSSGKLFLDWSGVARVYFPLTMLALWVVLFVSLMHAWSREGTLARIAKIVGLLLLLATPVLIFVASSPSVYPAFNPDTGGPTGTSQLESSLAIVAILLVLPYGLTKRKPNSSWPVRVAWIVLVAEAALCATLDRSGISHHRPVQYLSLGSLLLWLPLTPAYYAAFAWHSATRRWRMAFLWWWATLVASGWVLFLPGVLDRFKFTDGLVGHSLAALAGFVTALIIFVMTQLLGDEAWIFNQTWSFYAWNAGVLAYVVIMTIAGWLESSNPAFTIVSGIAHNLLYILRLLTGLAMLAASVDWMRAAAQIHRVVAPTEVQWNSVALSTMEKTA